MGITVTEQWVRKLGNCPACGSLKCTCKPEPFDPAAGEPDMVLAKRKRKGPNKIEQELLTALGNACDIARFEGVSFLLANGHRYTPDIYTVTERRITCYEVKGAYRHPSHGRSMLALDQAREENPHIVFVLATKTKEGWTFTQ
jgi:hypothetical protein